MNLIANIEELPKVSSTTEAKCFRGKAGSQDVLLDINDSDIAYFRQIDVNGNVFVDRRRCISEPELTQEEKNDMRYVSKKEFEDFMTEFKSFRKELSDNVRELTKSNTNDKRYTQNRYSEDKRN